MPKDFLQGASLTPTFEALMVKFGGKIGTLYQMLKNAFKKHPLQNRTNVQIKGGGVKGLLNNVQKNCTFLKRRHPLCYLKKTARIKLCYSIWSNRHISQLHFQMVGLTQNNSKGCLRWPPSWSSYWEVGGVGRQIFGERTIQLCSSNDKNKK